MKRLLVLALLLLLPSWCVPAQAQGFFSKRTVRPNPAERVPQLIVAIKTDPDERKRAQAADIRRICLEWGDTQGALPSNIVHQRLLIARSAGNRALSQ